MSGNPTNQELKLETCSIRISSVNRLCNFIPAAPKSVRIASAVGPARPFRLWKEPAVPPLSFSVRSSGTEKRSIHCIQVVSKPMCASDCAFLADKRPKPELAGENLSCVRKLLILRELKLKSCEAVDWNRNCPVNLGCVGAGPFEEGKMSASKFKNSVKRLTKNQ